MLYFAVPRLSVTAAGAQGYFAITWLIFALIVIAGNLTALLYSPKRKTQKVQVEKLAKKSRFYQ